MSRSLFPIFLLLAPMTSPSAFADEIDIPSLIAERIAGVMPNIYAQMGCGRCFGITPTEIRLIPVRVEYSEVITQPLPVKFSRKEFLFRNCSQDSREHSTTETVTYERGYTITKNRTIKSSANASLKYTIQGIDVGLTGTYGVDFADTTVANTRDQVVEVFNFKEVLRPWTDLKITLDKSSSAAFMDFSGVVDIDANLNVAMQGGRSGYLMYAGKLSDWVADRRFAVTGQIWNATSEGLRKNIQEIPYTKETCPTDAPDPNVVDISNIGKVVQSTPDASPIRGEEVVGLALDPAQLVERSLLGTTTVITGDAIASVKVRAQSLGPGACAVEFSVDGAPAAGVLAPPFSWSEWTPVATHFGSVTYSIGFAPICNTGALAEVQFYGPD